MTKRRRQETVVAALFLMLSMTQTNSFVAPSASRRPAFLMATRVRGADPTTASTWSLSAYGSEGSRFGVRKRVRAVLDRASKRTGVSNNSDDDLMIGQAASIGALDENADLVYREKSRAAAFRNGTDTELVLRKPSIRPRTQSEDYFVTADTGMADQVDPLPFQLPSLSDNQLRDLHNGERIQNQKQMGREGNGYVVFDVKAPPEAIWECLLDFQAYPDNIGTVRRMEMFTNTHLDNSFYSEKSVSPELGRATRHFGIPSVTRARFILSKFQLNIAAVHKYRPHPDGHYMEFSLDKACKNIVLKDAKGTWYTQSNPDGRTGYTRVWLLCELRVSRMLPTPIVDYASQRAMPRATTWLRPLAEKKWEEMRQDRPNGKVNGSSPTNGTNGANGSSPPR